MKKYTFLSLFGFLAVIVFLPFNSFAVTYTSQGGSVYYPSSGTSGGSSVNYCAPPSGFGYTTTAQCDGLRQQALANGSAQYTPEISQGIFQSCMNQVSAYQTAVRQYNNCLSQSPATNYPVPSPSTTLNQLEQQKIDATNTYISQKLEILKQQEAIDAEKYNIERQAQQDNNNQPTTVPPKVVTGNGASDVQTMPSTDNTATSTSSANNGEAPKISRNIFDRIGNWIIGLFKKIF